MKMKRAVSLVFVVIMVFAVSVTAFAAPYQNYTVTESGAYRSRRRMFRMLSSTAALSD